MSLPWPPERTIVQEQEQGDPRFDLRTDAVAVYGVNATFSARLTWWRQRGYRVHLMTGLAWGEYQDYLLGRWDGQIHWDEAQYRVDGTPQQHGADIPYMVPTEGYARYLAGLLHRAIDEGVEAIFLEEPEFWSFTGYGPAFERAWQAAYGHPWRDPQGDPIAFEMAARLKHHLYHDLVARLCGDVKDYSAGRPGGPVRCYVATHSPLNYTAWAIVSPELSLRRIPECDGMIVQTWSFTARSQTVYEGRTRERILPVAFLEYGSGVELARDSDRHLWFLSDPVEDRPNQGWDQYRTGYERTLVASLLWPEVGAYEAMPWPGRVFTGRYPRGADAQPIPQEYATILLTVANALRAIPEGPLEWDCGTRGVGVAISYSMMFRRGGPRAGDEQLSWFYGLALPPLLAGMPVRPIALENAPMPAATGSATGEHGADALGVLLLSYDGMTPPGSEAHQALADWVAAGGALICYGLGDGPYETLPGWWNDGAGDKGPWPDLHSRLGLPDRPDGGLYRVGLGVVVVEHDSPIDLADNPGGATRVRGQIRWALAALGREEEYRESPYLLLRRGPYAIAAAMEEAPGTSPDGPVLRLRGRYVNMLDAALPVIGEVALLPGEHALLLDLDRLESGLFAGGLESARSGAEEQAGVAVDQTGSDGLGRPACVVAAAARIEEEQTSDRTLRFRATGPAGTWAAIRVRLPAAPMDVSAGGAALDAAWDAGSGTALLRHPNAPEGVAFSLRW